jgi:hypothetical protein
MPWSTITQSQAVFDWLVVLQCMRAWDLGDSGEAVSPPKE